ncbi:MAG TPA: ABC transporter permease subunit [Anaerolineae bacterium]|nr:ABC transporter permease subunit [Anaerolineae bacterium]HOR00504.1 ABC transporter permease subunit [Anaerolineae bacterium]HPL28219.1 ABC transporter permease subunit [Anaerolineae bacterium]HPL28224.1 ABC transporter permease subunit [Anaerolineae bacterium]
MDLMRLDNTRSGPAGAGRKPPSRRRGPEAGAILWPLAGVALLIAAWGGLAAFYPPILVPSPLQVLGELGRLALGGRLWPALTITVARLAFAFALGSALGIALGLAAGRSAVLEALLRPGMGVAAGVPPIAWIALALIWFGTGSPTPIVVALLVTLPVVFASTTAGVHAIDRDLLAMAQVFGLRGVALVRELYLPALAPHLLAGLATAATLTVRIGIMGEFLASDTGVGSAMALARTQLNTAQVVAWVLVALALLWLSEGLLLGPLARRAAAWRTEP